MPEAKDPMTQRSALALTSPLLLAIVAAACGADDKDPADGSSTVTTGTMMPTGTVPPATTPGATSTAPVGTTPPGATSTPGTTTSPTGTDTAAPTMSAMPPMLSACTNLDYATQNNENDVSMFAGVQSVYFFGDTMTSVCATPSAGKVCVEGNALSSKGATDDYQFWGAGLGLQLAATGTPPVAFDATAQLITQVRFNLSGVSGRPVRVQISQVDDAAITDTAANYQNNAFGWGGSSPKDTKADAALTIPLADFKLPSWTKVLVDGKAASGQVLDASKIHSLQIQIANNPPDDPAAYGFCVDTLEWLDAAGAVVMVTKVTPPPMTSSSAPMGSDMPMASTTAPMTSASTGGEGGSGGMVDQGTGGAGGAGGMGGGGGDADPFDAAWEAFKTNCVPCHGDGEDHPLFASMTRETALMAAEMDKADIADRITRTGMGKMPPMGMLSAEDLAAIQAFTDAP